MTDEVWRRGNAPAGTVESALPGRAALTCTFALIRDETLLLVDPHPEGSWDQWMLPYGSLILARNDAGAGDLDELSQASTFRDVENVLEGLLRRNRRNYDVAIDKAVAALGLDAHIDLGADPIQVNYSLKYSSTSDSYTAYRFEYRAIAASATQVPPTALEINLRELAGDSDRQRKIAGRTIASNVFDFARAWVG